jgi:hypothetical protein
MNLQTQDVWVDTETQTDFMRFVKADNCDWEFGRGYLEKRPGVIILTVTEFKDMIDDAFESGEQYEYEREHLTKIKTKSKTEYINQLITP